MSRETRVICDNCGKVKQHVNHWFVIHVVSYEGQSRSLVIYSHDDGKPPCLDSVPINASEHQDACGQDCAMQAVSRFLSTGKIART